MSAISKGLNEIRLLLPCSKCGVSAGVMCRTKSGGSASYVHTDRDRVLSQAFWTGFDAAEGTYFPMVPDDLDRLTKSATRWLKRKGEGA